MKNLISQVISRIDLKIKLLVLTTLIAICLLLVFVVRNGAVPSDWDNVEITPVIFPPFIQQVYPNPDNNRSVLSMVCITIDIPAIWEGGDTLEGVENHINETLQIEFDNALISRHTKELLGGGSVIRSDGVALGNLKTCEPVQITVGQHTVSVNWISTAKKNFSYVWSFRTEGVQSIDPGDQNLNLLVYYDSWRGTIIDQLGSS